MASISDGFCPGGATSLSLHGPEWLPGPRWTGKIPCWPSSGHKCHLSPAMGARHPWLTIPGPSKFPSGAGPPPPMPQDLPSQSEQGDSAAAAASDGCAKSPDSEARTERGLCTLYPWMAQIRDICRSTACAIHKRNLHHVMCRRFDSGQRGRLRLCGRSAWRGEERTRWWPNARRSAFGVRRVLGF